MSFPTPSAPASPFLQGPKHLRVWPLEFTQGGDHELGCFPWGSLPVCLLTECSQGRVRDAQLRFGAGGRCLEGLGGMALGSAHPEHVAGAARVAAELAVKQTQTQGACPAPGSKLRV